MGNIRVYSVPFRDVPVTLGPAKVTLGLAEKQRAGVQGAEPVTSETPGTYRVKSRSCC